MPSPIIPRAMPEGGRNLTHCPSCGREVDKMRAGSVGIFSGRITYFCSRECKETFSSSGRQKEAPFPIRVIPAVPPSHPARTEEEPEQAAPDVAGPVSRVVPARERQPPRARLLRWVVPAALAAAGIAAAWISVTRGWVGVGPLLGFALLAPAMIAGIVLSALEWRTTTSGRALDDLLVVAGALAYAVPGLAGLLDGRTQDFVPGILGPLGVLAAVWAMRALEVGLATSLEELPELGSLHARGVLASLVNRPEEWGRSRFVRHAGRLALVLAIVAVPAGACVLLVSWLMSGRSGGALPWPMAAAVVLGMSPRLVRNIYPASTAAALLNGRADGIVFSDDRSLEMAGRVDALVLRKRGVLAEAATEVEDLHLLGDLPRGVVLSLLMSCEEIASGSEVAAAIQRFARAEGVRPGDTRLTRHVPSRGIQSTSPFGEIFAGSRLFLIENGISVARGESAASEAERKGHTAIFVSVNRKIEAVLVLENRIRASARSVVDGARRMGISTILVTGDSARSSEVIASQVGVDQVRPEIGLAGREREIERVRDAGHRLAVLGSMDRGAPRQVDSRDLSIGIGWDGVSPVDPGWGVAVSEGDLPRALRAIEIGRSARRFALAGIVIAVVAGITGLGLAASGLASPLVAALMVNAAASVMAALRPRLG